MHSRETVLSRRIKSNKTAYLGTVMKSWVIYIAAALGFAIYGAVTDVDRDDNGAIVGGGSVDAFNVKIGDCFNDTFGDDEEVTNVPGVPCSDPHDNEAFAIIDLTLDSYPN